MRTWNVGSVRISQIVEQVLPAGIPGLIPDATPEALLQIEWLYPEFITETGEPSLSLHAFVLDTPTLRILVDTCVGNDKNLSIVPGWNHMQTSFLGKMEEAGFSRDSIDIVVCTHLHLDHVGWNTMMVDGAWVPTFPRARYLFGREEFGHMLAESAGPTENVDWQDCVKTVLDESIAPVVEAGLVDFVETDHRICGEVHLKPTPGHTLGHVSVWISSEGKNAIITGDAVHHPCQLAHPEWSTHIDISPETSSETRRKLFDEAVNTPALVLGTHWAGAGGGMVVREKSAFRVVV